MRWQHEKQRDVFFTLRATFRVGVWWNGASGGGIPMEGPSRAWCINISVN